MSHHFSSAADQDLIMKLIHRDFGEVTARLHFFNNEIPDFCRSRTHLKVFCTTSAEVDKTIAHQQPRFDFSEVL